MNCPPLGSIEAVRPVFMIVMGVFLVVIAWRICERATGWTARMIISGALLLGFGYAVMLPMYEAGSIQRYSPKGHSHGDSSSAVAWHSVKLVVMNSGWLLLGLGLAMHSKTFTAIPLRRKISSPAPHASHESVA